ncbi:hypothetical protein D3OALGB2SA_2617 [Olavius algarvensis associated proteobacterium Delta 3]|nr:hypothetical protein D3OALGB2SA_2617 [Olavius algarvensis associated proteobacterium Delta 3]
MYSDFQNSVPIHFTINLLPQSRRVRRVDIDFALRCPTTPLPSAGSGQALRQVQDKQDIEGEMQTDRLEKYI